MNEKMMTLKPLRDARTEIYIEKAEKKANKLANKISTAPISNTEEKQTHNGYNMTCNAIFLTHTRGHRIVYACMNVFTCMDKQIFFHMRTGRPKGNRKWNRS